jgi:hypothetical protein
MINLLQSSINEGRLLALLMLVEPYQKGDLVAQETIYRLYQAHIK